MKVTHRIPTTQYGYVEISFDGTEDASDPDKVRLYHENLLDAFKEKPETTLSEDEMTEFVYNQIKGNKKNHIETWEKMSPAQKTSVNQIKKALLRK